MKQCRWPVVVAALAVVGACPPGFAQDSFTGPPATPRPFTQDDGPGVGRAIGVVDNFTGNVAGALIQGTGKDNKGNTLQFEVDVRLMQGIYMGRDGSTYRGTFCFT
jgi:hypothetical protein